MLDSIINFFSTKEETHPFTKNLSDEVYKIREEEGKNMDTNIIYHIFSSSNFDFFQILEQNFPSYILTKESVKQEEPEFLFIVKQTFQKTINTKDIRDSVNDFLIFVEKNNTIYLGWDVENPK